MKTCATDGCTLHAAGKSKYCREHRKAARAAWKEMIGRKADERVARGKGHADLYDKAHAAGVLAAGAKIPIPMIVQQHANPLNDNSPVTQQWQVDGGVCGFAWITVRPGNSSFALWLKKNKDASKSYRGGMEIWVSAYCQSMERKEAYAQAFTDILREAGLNAYAGSRMD